jgi:exopolyphosphatase/pppGpp-phosphohydrolase
LQDIPRRKSVVATATLRLAVNAGEFLEKARKSSAARFRLSAVKRKRA